jgi:hypothetical protein
MLTVLIITGTVSRHITVARNSKRVIAARANGLCVCAIDDTISRHVTALTGITDAIRFGRRNSSTVSLIEVHNEGLVFDCDASREGRILAAAVKRVDTDNIVLDEWEAQVARAAGWNLAHHFTQSKRLASPIRPPGASPHPLEGTRVSTRRRTS